jgi:orotidine-5'-phosphate decarboxylase
MSVGELVAQRARQAAEAGVAGIVCAPSEARAARAVLGPSLSIVTPGIRLAGGDAGDQKRVATPGDAVAAGASHIVVGRPITAAVDPALAARQVLADLIVL